MASKMLSLLRRHAALLIFACSSFIGAGALAQTTVYPGPSDPAYTDAGYNWSRNWVDIDGDGRDDYCQLSGDNAENLDCYVSTGVSFKPLQRYAGLGSGKNLNTIHWADVNGDGYVDFCRIAPKQVDPNGPDPYGTISTMTCWYGPSFGQSGVSRTDIPTAASIRTSGEGDYVQYYGLFDYLHLYFADVDGDGRSDLCFINQGASAWDLRCMLANGSGFSAPTAQWIRSGVNGGSEGWPVGFYDFNGDGFPDFCQVIYDNQLNCVLGGPSGFTGTVTSPGISMPHKEGAAFVDVNGDGNIDFCRILDSSGQSQIYCRVSTGVAWDTVERLSPVLNAGDADKRWWADVNGDGLPDFCFGLNGGMSCRLSRGDGDGSSSYIFGFSDASASNVDFGLSDGGRAFCDPYGTGVVTFCREYSSNWPVAFGLKTGLYGAPTDHNTVGSVGSVDFEQAPQALLTSYTDGVGADTHINYLPMTDPLVYTRHGTSSYPRSILVQPRSSVVFETRAWQSGSLNTLTGNARYFYRNLRNDAWAGSRGFRERWIYTEGSNVFDHVVYYQGLGPSIDASSVLNDPREIGQVKFEEKYAGVAALAPAPTAPSGMTLRVDSLASLTNAAISVSQAGGDAVGAVPAAAPTSTSPFILLQSTTNTLGDTSPANSRYRYLKSSTANAFDWDGSRLVAMPQSTTTTVMDDVGNVTSIVQTTTAPNGLVWKKTTTNVYGQDDRSRWILGRLTSATVKSESPSPDAQIAAYARSAGHLPNASSNPTTPRTVQQQFSPEMLMPILQMLLDD